MNLLDIKNLTINNGNLKLFNDVNFSIDRNEIKSIKCSSDISSELINLILNITSFSIGEIKLLETSNYNLTKKLLSEIGLYTINDGLYMRLTPYQYLSYFKKLYNSEIDIDQMLNHYGLHKHRSTKINKLSSSQQRRLSIMRVFLHTPDFAIIQNPFDNVDLESRILIKKIILDANTNGTGILILSNDIDNCFLTTESVYIYEEGKILPVSFPEENTDDNISDEETEKPPMNSVNTTIVSKDSVVSSVDTSFTESNDSSSKKSNQESAKYTVSIEDDEKNVTSSKNDDINMNISLKFNKVPAKVDDKIILFNPTDIIYCESRDRAAVLHTVEGEFQCSLTLAQLEQKLKAFGFFRCHRSYIVNLQNIKELIAWSKNSYSLILNDKTKSEIPLSKGRIEELKTILGI
ncbi:LytTR family transcriptional regulator DNA-binding domain-containing protein [Oceanirhabdus seepicola]|uniref:LytTR family transcriptional regulator DNA-binding domain-containing protein n=1 Tax=Oceanirhabdus seepicola TaxID=2828781 RepID=A0A9J6NZM7_9CLOT|nr:LytTR family transcriptional regulator DNA-binding domain-containing protein [Oceanirhabdus seepicola]MCM1989069.1 LytTR family transcriptional regulator DNA-binding domain-containing protein [Oceanirhabdus seepicola]